jgi:hypothetical protein
MLLNGFNRTPFKGRLIACRPDDLLHPIENAAKHAAEAKFLTALPRHEPGWLLLTESRRHQAVKVLRQIPFIGPLRAAQLVALMQTPHRFRSKRQLWTYSGLAVETHDSAQYRYVDGQLQRSKKPQQVRGLNQNHNHAMKEIFKSAALSAALRAGPFQDFYEGLLARGMKPELARVTLARKIAAITLTLWKKGACFDAGYVKRQAA